VLSPKVAYKEKGPGSFELPGPWVFSSAELDHVVVVDTHGAGPLAKGLMKPSQQQQQQVQVEVPITMW
jgi:hypothetical protein